MFIKFTISALTAFLALTIIRRELELAAKAFFALSVLPLIPFCLLGAILALAAERLDTHALGLRARYVGRMAVRPLALATVATMVACAPHAAPPMVVANYGLATPSEVATPSAGFDVMHHCDGRNPGALDYPDGCLHAADAACAIEASELGVVLHETPLGASSFECVVDMPASGCTDDAHAWAETYTVHLDATAYCVIVLDWSDL